MPNGKPRRIVKSFDHAIDVLGGPSEAGERLGRTAVQVCQWRVRYNKIPPELYPTALRELEKEGFDAPLRLFRWEEFRKSKRKAG